MEGTCDEALNGHKCCCCERRKKIADKSLAEAASDHFSSYCSDTSIHGLQYVGDQSRPRLERILWAVLFVCCIGASAHLIRELWLKWERSPVIVTFAETSVPVWQVPFPAVTICSETKVSHRVFNFTEAYNNRTNLTGADLKKFEDLCLLCNEANYSNGDTFVDNSIVELFKNVTPAMEETIMAVKYQGPEEVEAQRFFRPLLTEEGLCFTFNMLNASDFYTDGVLQRKEGFLDYGEGRSGWTPDFGYGNSANLSAYPSRAIGSGTNNGMSTYLFANEADMDYVCRGPMEGFKLLLHSPAEVPRIGEHFIHVPLSHHVTISVRPTMITTSEGLREYLPHRRQCYFSYERKLRYFRHYTQKNCHMECLTNNTLRKCGCVSFYMPRTEGIRICGKGSETCVQKTKVELIHREVEKSINGDGEASTNSVSECDCLPACTSLEYDVETSVADLSVKKFLIATNFDLSQNDGLKFSGITIYFKDTQFIPRRRSELYGRTDFLANCGGLLGLFMGVSFLSLIEIVYYFSVRIFCSTVVKKKADTRRQT